jgi:hypothetical protein
MTMAAASTEAPIPNTKAQRPRVSFIFVNESRHPKLLTVALDAELLKTIRWTRTHFARIRLNDDQVITAGWGAPRQIDNEAG